MLNQSWTNLNPRSLCSPHLQRGSSRIPLSGILPHFIFSAYYTTAKPGAVLSIQFSPTPVCNKFHLSSRTRHLLSLASPGCIYQGQGSLLCTIYWGQNRLLCMVFTWILSCLRGSFVHFMLSGTKMF